MPNQCGRSGQDTQPGPHHTSGTCSSGRLFLDADPTGHPLCTFPSHRPLPLDTRPCRPRTLAVIRFSTSVYTQQNTHNLLRTQNAELDLLDRPYRRNGWRKLVANHARRTAHTRSTIQGWLNQEESSYRAEYEEWPTTFEQTISRC